MAETKSEIDTPDTNELVISNDIFCKMVEKMVEEQIHI